MDAAGLPEPEYVNDDDYYLKLTLRNNLEKRVPRLKQDVSSFIPPNNDEIKLNDDQITILQAVWESPSATYAQLAESTGFSESKVHRILGFLKDADIIRREGSRKSGVWRVVKKAEQ